MVAGVGTWGAVSAFRDIGATQLGTSQADRRSYGQIEGTYSKTLTNEDPVVRANDMAGTYDATRARRRDAPIDPSGLHGGGIVSLGISFRLSGDRFTTNAFVNLTCEVGLYEWDLREDRLTLIALQDPCDVRVALFGTTPWQRAR